MMMMMIMKKQRRIRGNNNNNCNLEQHEPTTPKHTAAKGFGTRPPSSTVKLSSLPPHLLQEADPCGLCLSTPSEFTSSHVHKDRTHWDPKLG